MEQQQGYRSCWAPATPEDIYLLPKPLCVHVVASAGDVWGPGHQRLLAVKRWNLYFLWLYDHRNVHEISTPSSLSFHSQFVSSSHTSVLVNFVLVLEHYLWPENAGWYYPARKCRRSKNVCIQPYERSPVIGKDLSWECTWRMNPQGVGMVFSPDSYRNHCDSNRYRHPKG